MQRTPMRTRAQSRDRWKDKQAVKAHGRMVVSTGSARRCERCGGLIPAGAEHTLDRTGGPVHLEHGEA